MYGSPMRMLNEKLVAAEAFGTGASHSANTANAARSRYRMRDPFLIVFPNVATAYGRAWPVPLHEIAWSLPITLGNNQLGTMGSPVSDSNGSGAKETVPPSATPRLSGNTSLGGSILPRWSVSSSQGRIDRMPAMDNPVDVIRRLRAQAFAIGPADLELAPTPSRPRVWGAIMELGYPTGIATLLSIAEGTTSLYFSNGGGIVGAGEHANVREAAEVFLDVMEAHLAEM